MSTIVTSPTSAFTRLLLAQKKELTHAYMAAPHIGEHREKAARVYQWAWQGANLAVASQTPATSQAHSSSSSSPSLRASSYSVFGLRTLPSSLNRIRSRQHPAIPPTSTVVATPLAMAAIIGVHKYLKRGSAGHAGVSDSAHTRVGCAVRNRVLRPAYLELPQRMAMTGGKRGTRTRRSADDGRR